VYEIPTEGICVNILDMKSRFQAPFRITLLGTIINVQDVASTNNGSPKRLFDIIDKMGAFCHCCALSHNALNLALEEQMEAVLYHGTGRSPIGNSPGMVYFMKDALIVPVGVKAVVPQELMEITIE